MFEILPPLLEGLHVEPLLLSFDCHSLPSLIGGWFIKLIYCFVKQHGESIHEFLEGLGIVNSIACLVDEQVESCNIVIDIPILHFNSLLQDHLCPLLF